MASVGKELIFTWQKSAILRHWKIQPGSRLTQGRVLFLFSTDNELKEEATSEEKFKSSVEGIAVSLTVGEGSKLYPGCTVLRYQDCSHATIIKDLCAECGTDLRQLSRDSLAQVVASTSVSMVHTVPELRVNQEQAQKLGQADEDRYLKSRKLALLVDLDQTLIHTTNDNVPNNMKDVYHFQLYGPRSPWYHTRLRPGTRNFLKKMSLIYELHICTFGARAYAHMIAQLIDPGGNLFSHRILSRDECFNPSSKTGNLKALFPCGDSMVCIIDDREDVWNFAPNMVQVKPYHFFKNTGDINAPPGLGKTGESFTFPRPLEPLTGDELSPNKNDELKSNTETNREKMSEIEELETVRTETQKSVKESNNVENSEELETTETQKSVKESSKVENSEELETTETQKSVKESSKVENSEELETTETQKSVKESSKVENSEELETQKSVKESSKVENSEELETTETQKSVKESSKVENSEELETTETQKSVKESSKVENSETEVGKIIRTQTTKNPRFSGNCNSKVEDKATMKYKNIEVIGSTMEDRVEDSDVVTQKHANIHDDVTHDNNFSSTNSNSVEVQEKDKGCKANTLVSEGFGAEERESEHKYQRVKSNLHAVDISKNQVENNRSEQYNEDIVSLMTSSGADIKDRLEFEKKQQATSNGQSKNQSSSHPSKGEAKSLVCSSTVTYPEVKVRNLAAKNSKVQNNSDIGEGCVTSSSDEIGAYVAKVENKPSGSSKEEEGNEDVMDVLDEDDYLLYLEEILQTIHKAYYDIYNQMKTQGHQDIPDLKYVIPYVRRKVLKGVNIVFSGVIPTNMIPEKSKPWIVAKSLGANVFKDLIPASVDKKKATTHVIAAKLGTAKVNRAKRMKGVEIVTPTWLWCCNERWEKVNEKLFPLTKDSNYKINPISQNTLNEMRFLDVQSQYFNKATKIVHPDLEDCPVYDPVTGKRVRQQNSSLPLSSRPDVPDEGIFQSDDLFSFSPQQSALVFSTSEKSSASCRFSESYSPLLAFSKQDLKDMDQEVEDACSENSGEGRDDDEEESDVTDLEVIPKKCKEDSSESSSIESLSGGECPRKWKKRKWKQDFQDALEDEEFDSDDDERLIKFRRMESYESDKSDSEEYNESIGSVDEEMAAAVEREFLNS
ncbi:RNA polymerase II subunit A C-terminal domain phosphatase-like [Tachypleus tridentatus]|uniref:RNA polymerase II subunit A C-terminal domain phosphatase-like n=1 Tax=Tachypleus tridentatus TaxID=6853 RepID=UPI003FD5414C